MPEKTEVSLTDLMNTLLAFNDPTPCYIYTTTVEPMIQKSRTTNGPDGKPVINPCLDCERRDIKGKPTCKLLKHVKQMIRVNDNYESAVIRRQILEAANRGETVKADDLFVADHAAWGAKVDSDTPSLFEWWIPEYITDGSILFYMAYRPVQCLDVQFEVVQACKIYDREYAVGDFLDKDVVKKLRAEYMEVRDDEMDAMRQGVDKAVGWRKVTFNNIREMSIGGVQYKIVDHTMPPVPEKQRERLLKMVADREERKLMKERAKLDEKAAKKAAKGDVKVVDRSKDAAKPTKEPQT